MGVKGIGQWYSLRASAPLEDKLRRAWATNWTGQPKIGELLFLKSFVCHFNWAISDEDLGAFCIMWLNHSSISSSSLSSKGIAVAFAGFLMAWDMSSKHRKERPPRFSKQYCRIFRATLGTAFINNGLKALPKTIRFKRQVFIFSGKDKCLKIEMLEDCDCTIILLEDHNLDGALCGGSCF